MKVINLYGGPGTGKSTIAASIFSKLKFDNIPCEMSLEYAKDCVWEDRKPILEDQLYILAKQYRRLLRLSTHGLEYVVTDSPLLFSLVYGRNQGAAFKQLVRDKFNEFDNINIFLKRTKPYSQYGRGQSEEEAKMLDETILECLDENYEDFTRITADEYAAEKIIGLIRTNHTSEKL